jgi:hypothetical protein
VSHLPQSGIEFKRIVGFMAQREDVDRSAFREIGNNSFLDFSDDEARRLIEIATELQAIIIEGRKRIRDGNPSLHLG